MATDQQFCLRWNNHQSTLISVFDSLLENGTLVDCTLAAEGQYLKAHKVVLSACSPYLETLLSQHYEKHPIVILKDVKFTELKSMMDYMYRGEVNISQDQLGTFLKAAESLQIKGLSDNGDDGAGPTTTKRQDSSRSTVTEVRNVESKRPAPSMDLSDASREGSISPSSSMRKRRRTRRSSQGDDPDSHLDATSNVCDFPNQSTPLPVPSTTVVPTPVQNIPKQIVKQEPSISRIDNSLNSSIAPESGLLKEKIEPPSEPLLEPKTEYLEYMNNENSIEVEDLTLDDDEDLDSSMDASRPGPSHGDMSNQGYQWPMGDQSGTDEIFMAAQQAVGAATGQQRDSQGMESFFCFDFSKLFFEELKIEKDPLLVREKNEEKSILTPIINVEDCKLEEIGRTNTQQNNMQVDTQDPNAEKYFMPISVKEMAHFPSQMKMTCEECKAVVTRRIIYYHKKYQCGPTKDKPFNKNWVIRSGSGYCLKCKRLYKIHKMLIHSNYLCGKKIVKCFFCFKFFNTAHKGKLFVNFMRHASKVHGKSIDDLNDLIMNASEELLSGKHPQSVTPSVEGMGFPIVVQCNICDQLFQRAYLRIHKKYYCGQNPDERDWKMNEKGVFCQKCSKKVRTDDIEFHTKYMCGKQIMTVECFYCSSLHETYSDLLSHMRKQHGRNHCLLDLLSIMPEADDEIPPVGSKNYTRKVVLHGHGSSTVTSLPFVLAEHEDLKKPMYFDPTKMPKCLYCEQEFKYIFETIDHMQENHSANHNTYDVLKGQKK